MFRTDKGHCKKGSIFSLIVCRLMPLVVIGLVLQVGSLQMATAGALTISPIRLDFPANQVDTSFRLRNDADVATTVQIRAYTWRIEGDRDQLNATRQILIAPAIVTIQPKSDQLIRAQLRGPRAADVELPFRVLISEIPAPVQQPTSGIHVLLNIGIPAFVAPTESVQDTPRFAISSRVREADGEKHLLITLENNGNRHARLNKLKIINPNAYPNKDDSPIHGIHSVQSKETVIFSQQEHTYVLARGKRTWQVPLSDAAAESLTDVGITLEADGQAMHLISSVSH